MAASGSPSDTAVLLDGASPPGSTTSLGDARLEPQRRDTASLKQAVAPFSARWNPVQGPDATAPATGPAASWQPPLLPRPFSTVTAPRTLAWRGEALVLGAPAEQGQSLDYTTQILETVAVNSEMLRHVTG
jgi:hypothetical protein